MNYCIVVPHYNHENQLVRFLPQLLDTGYPCIVVDDGSEKTSIERLEQSIEASDNVHLIKHAFNRGKGAAVKTGFVYARLKGFTHVVQIDADGQHNVDDINRFVVASKTAPSSFICGKPVFDESVPKERLYGRKVTDFWVAIETLSRKIKDGLCGFRIYPLNETEKLMDKYHIGPRMDFDTEILVKAVWEDFDLHFMNTHVVYPEESVSHFNYLRDNLLLIRLHTRLVTGMIIRIPVLLFRKLKGR